MKDCKPHWKIISSSPGIVRQESNVYVPKILTTTYSNYAIFFQGDDRIYDGLFRLYQYGDHRCQMFVMQFAPTLISNYFATFGRRVVLSVSHQCWKYNTFNLFNETSDSQNFHLLSHFQFQALYKVAYIYYSWFILLGSWKIGNSFVVHLQ